ncbi:hypothetical protein [Alkalicoccus urumqiensis]|uniref:hypothetical protein n=1 Tax=Alkalicoccus urumqiensis TaxID=1548213 RepID=UPI0015E5CBDE|nr:hypothetical protein [Alkalicoccus urumqiensis]
MGFLYVLLLIWAVGFLTARLLRGIGSGRFFGTMDWENDLAITGAQALLISMALTFLIG